MIETKITNPYDNRVIATVPVFDESQVREAIGRAAQAEPIMATLPAHERGATLNRAAALIAENADSLARLMARESGKPLKLAQVEVARAVETFSFAADEARRLHGETVPMDAAQSGVGRIGFYLRVPVGIVAAITPFNFPLNLVAHKIAPAVAAGCPLVLKPSPLTPLTALRLSDILAEAGLPAGAFEVVLGDADVGHWLVTDPRIAMISFTGSTQVARQITQVAGLRRVALELGGNAATIIESDANLDQAIARCIGGSFAYSGQSCISIQRIYIQRSIYDEFRHQFLKQTGNLRLGSPLQENTDIGPLISDAAAERIIAWVNSAVEQGAWLLAGGEREGRMVAPVVLENVDEMMEVMCQEVFGPVVSLLPYDRFDEALRAVINSPFGLQAGVYTRDIYKAMQAVRALKVGGVMINEIPSYRADHMPYGGVKDSGMGREGPRFAVEAMTDLKMVVINTEAG
jgi:acyl-CoA reductase-like NAD-dependent aldehyde dehydrogenase